MELSTNYRDERSELTHLCPDSYPEYTELSKLSGGSLIIAALRGEDSGCEGVSRPFSIPVTKMTSHASLPAIVTVQFLVL